MWQDSEKDFEWVSSIVNGKPAICFYDSYSEFTKSDSNLAT